MNKAELRDMMKAERRSLSPDFIKNNKFIRFL